MKLFTSLKARLLVFTVTTAAFTFSTLVGLVVLGVDYGLSQQTIEISRWSEERLSHRLLGDARLSRSRTQTMFDDVMRRFATLARRTDIVQAIQSRNTVAISELLEPALDLADVNGALILDNELRVIGAHRLDVDILKANTLLPRISLASEIRDIIKTNDPQNPRGVRKPIRFDEPIAAALGAKRTSALAEIFVEPLFDDFGDVVSVIIGYRQIKAHEPSLEEFAKLSERSVVIFSDGEQVSSAGIGLPHRRVVKTTIDVLFNTDAEHVARCIELWADAEICAIAPNSELQQLANQVISMGEDQTKSLIIWLIIVAAGSMLLFALMSLLVSRQVTRPLVEITGTVSLVAEGDWRTPVPWTNRTDEVGDIAKAVVILERSLEERDRLRADVVSQNIDLVHKEESLREQNMRFDAALNNMSQGLCMFDACNRLTVANERYIKMYRLRSADLPRGTPLRLLLHLCVEAGSYAARACEALEAEQLAVVQARKPITLMRELADGRLVAISHQPMGDGGWVETHEDVTEQKAAEAHIAHMARHDALTDLPNRTLFQERMEEAIAAAQRGAREFAVLCLDLDNFKGINDTLGHGAGDELLRLVSERLLGSVDHLDTVARLGGDEFAIIHMTRRAFDSADTLATRLIEILRQPYHISGQLVVSGASIGIAASATGRDTAEQLLRSADLALYTAKAEGRGTYRVFEPAMDDRFQKRQNMERDLRRALSSNELEVFYQPLFNIKQNEISGFEALVRWHHPVRGPVSPDEFIPLAEDVGLIDALGAWVLREACVEATYWPSHLKIAVNISSVQFRDKSFVQTVKNVIAASNLVASRLELEITESVVLHDDSETLAILHQLRELGIRFSMDDFGTGYSSLSSLRTFPFDKIKLDQSFMRDYLETDCAAIIQTVANLGKNLRMSTTAEGVETSAQLATLRSNGFIEAQGFLFSPALPSQEARALIERSHQLTKVA